MLVVVKHNFHTMFHILFQGVKFLRRFKQLLNPAQVFDLMNGGPHPG